MVLAIDNINKFMSTTSCLQRMYDISRSVKGGLQQSEEAIKYEFVGSSVISQWGNKRAYIVHSVNFRTNPFTQEFVDSNNNKRTVANYFQEEYGVKIKTEDQPLFVCKVGGKDIHIPPEFCTIDGIPEQIRTDGHKFRNVLQTIRKDPSEKLYEISNFSKTLLCQDSLKKWGIEIDARPLSMETDVLPMPQIRRADGSIC